MPTRACFECGERLPLTAEHYWKNGVRRDGVQRWKTRCRGCHPAFERKMRATMSPEAVARQRERDRQRAAERRADGAEAEKMREAVRRYRERVKRDPAKLRQRREAQRMYHRLKTMERGAMPRPRPRQRGDFMPELPAPPLVEAVDRLALDAAGIEAVCARLEIAPRNLSAWRSGERRTVEFDVADRALTRGGLLWFDVWAPDCPEALRAFEGVG